MATVATLVPAVTAHTAGHDDPATGTAADLWFDRARYAHGDCVTIAVADADQNLDHESLDAVVAHVTVAFPEPEASGDAETVKLEETGPATGIFQSECLPLLVVDGEEAQPANGVLEVNAGNVLAGFYLDPDNPDIPEDEEEMRRQLDELRQVLDGAADLAVVAGGQPSGKVTIEIDASLTPEDLAVPIHGGDLPPSPVGVILGPSGMPISYPEDQVVFQPLDDRDLEAFLEQHDATVLDTFDIPQAADQQPEDQRTAMRVVRVDPSGGALEDLAYLAELFGASGRYLFSSQDAARLFSILLAEQLGGRLVHHNPLAWLLGPPRTSEHGGRNGFQGWFDPNDDAGVDAAEALLYLDLIDRNEPLSVEVAFVDGGFAGPGAYPSGTDNPDWGMPFEDIRGAICVLGGDECIPGTPSGPNPVYQCAGPPGPACDWHGTAVWSIAGAVANNNHGAMGVAGHARDATGADGASGLIRPFLVLAGTPALFSTMAKAINAAAREGVDVINVSMGFACEPFLGIDFCRWETRAALFVVLCAAIPAAALALSALGIGGAIVGFLIALMSDIGCLALKEFVRQVGFAERDALAAAVRAAHARDIPVVAAGPETVTFLGDDHGPFDAEDIEFIPCTLGGVICVGAVTRNAARAAVPDEINPFGPGIDVWAPVDFVVTPTPADESSVVPFVGTSAATPFVSGALAMMRMLNSSLTRSDLVRIVQNTSNVLAATPRRSCVARPSDPSRCVGHVNVLAALRAVHDAGLPCTGWEEIAADNDHLASAVRLGRLPTPDPGDTASVTVANSIHALPTDRDMYRFEPPALPPDRGPLVGLRFELRSPPSFGALDAALHPITVVEDGEEPPVERTGRATATGAEFETTIGRTGEYLIDVFATSPRGIQDNCYRAEIEVVNPPDGDRYEANNTLGQAAVPTESWTHEPHFRCPPEVRRAIGREDCSDVFDDRVATGGAQEVWTLHVPDLSLHTGTDTDFFSVTIPDPSVAHGDVRPEGSPVPEPEPLVECGMYTRQSLFGDDVDVTTTATLTIRATPTRNATSARALEGDGEQLHLYRDSGEGLRHEPDLGGPGPLVKIIPCPRTAVEEGGLDLDALTLSFGERTSLRSLFAAGGYELLLEYKVEVHRGVPREIQDAAERNAVRALGCTELGLLGPIGPDLGVPREHFPFCSPDDQGLAHTEVPHPLNPQRVDRCAADGPGCPDHYVFNWPATITPFDLLFTATAPMGFHLLDETGKLVATAEPVSLRDDHHAPSLTGSSTATGTTFASRLRISDLSAGPYLLIVDGPAGVFRASFVPPQTTAIDIMPGDDIPTLNARRKGTVPVAVLSTPFFDASTVQAETVSFGPGRAATMRARAQLEDVNGDGRPDLVLHFDAQDSGLRPGHRGACLHGRSDNDEPFEGCSRVRVIGK